jgi:hypothetical protein
MGRRIDIDASAWSRMGRNASGHVIHVADGDTITVLDSKHQQLRVRLGVESRDGKRQRPGAALLLRRCAQEVD